MHPYFQHVVDVWSVLSSTNKVWVGLRSAGRLSFRFSSITYRIYILIYIVVFDVGPEVYDGMKYVIFIYQISKIFCFLIIEGRVGH